MKFLNIGCGSTFHSDWTNIDLVPSSPNIHAYDIRKKLPYPDDYFDACYSSHVIEHLTQGEAQNLLAEALRILKPQGVMRVVVPDLESVVKIYLHTLEQVEAGITEVEADYDWIMLELYDQAVRHFGGGEMGRYLARPEIKNNDFILSRIGLEAEGYWTNRASIDNKKSLWDKIKPQKPSWVIKKLRMRLAKNLVRLIAGSEMRDSFEEAVFRNSGEIHRWMYDRFSLRRMFEHSGFVYICVCCADESRIPDFNRYELDVIAGKVRRPNSLFMEGVKP